MKWLFVFIFSLCAKHILAQFDIASLTGFTLKSSKAQVSKKVNSLGGWIPESTRNERDFGANGLKLLNQVNSVVIFSFYEDQLYKIGIAVDAKSETHMNVIHKAILDTLSARYGAPLIKKEKLTAWLADHENTGSDKIIVTKDEYGVNIQFTEAELLNKARPKTKSRQ